MVKHPIHNYRLYRNKEREQLLLRLSQIDRMIYVELRTMYVCSLERKIHFDKHLYLLLEQFCMLYVVEKKFRDCRSM